MALPENNMGAGRILVVEDDESFRRVAQGLLEKSGYEVLTAADAARGLQILQKESVDLILTDLNLPGDSGLDLLRKVRLDYPDAQVVMLTGYGSIETAVEAMRNGAFDYLTKPIRPDELRTVVRRVLERRRLLEEVQQLRSLVDQKYGFENVIGHSPKFLHAVQTAARVAPSDVTILIRGETGTGKEVLAKAIHFNSPRRDRPFAVINCGSIPGELLESELFGHVKGSFTGALNHKKGKVEAANGGTVFLDEIGEMPLDLQVRVLRLAQEHEITKVGATANTEVDVRIIAATHRNLEAMIAEGKFREDLYYRLAVIPITLPPLRERQDDIPDFVAQFFSRCKQKHNRPGLHLPVSLMRYFTGYPWPGNVRELENVIERLVLLCRSDEVTLSDLPDILRQDRSNEPPQAEIQPDGVGLAAVERNLILQALTKCDWNRAKAARELDITRKTLCYRMAKYGIQREDSGAEPDEDASYSVGDDAESELQTRTAKSRAAGHDS